ncbi:MAG: hypothetical protein JWP81_1575 [Ferruginibacter sp.]|nr:hypothetical protein [Ferruginibacter sp.]
MLLFLLREGKISRHILCILFLSSPVKVEIQQNCKQKFLQYNSYPPKNYYCHLLTL